MGFRKVVVREAAAKNIAAISWHLKDYWLLLKSLRMMPMISLLSFGIAEKVIDPVAIQKGT